MRLKKLKLTGFKSFCDDTELEFKANGITMIVGPNGCGKSNVADAIRWVLGEQSPRHLRGQAMGDVIFAGSDARKPVGRGEVTIQFDNTNGGAPEKYRDFSEISVTRRLYRSGESEYLINKIPCRLMDIRELVMDTGAAGRSYSIVEQGRVEEIITASPAERRIFMEEAAGIVRYKTKRIAAERKLEQTQTNLLRVSDLLGELQRQEIQLRGQKEKAGQYRALREQVETLTGRLAQVRYRQTQKRARELEKSRDALAAEAAQLQNALAAMDAELTGLGLEQTQREAQVQREREELAGQERELHREETELALERQNRDNNRDWVGQLSQGRAGIDSESSALDEETGSARETLELVRRQEQALAGEVERLEERHQAGQTARQEGATELQALRENLLECHTQLTGSANQQQFLRERLEEGQRRRSGLEGQLAENTREKETLGRKLIGEREAAQTLRTAAAETEARREKLRAEIAANSDIFSHKRDLCSELERDSVECGSRLASLRQLEANREDFADNVRAVLAWAERSPERCEALGWLGPLADHLRLPEEVAPGVEDFLAPYLETIVVRQFDRLPELQKMLEQANLGGVRLVALDSFPANGAAGHVSPNLAEVVILPAGFEPLAQGLFGGVRLHPAGKLPVPLPPAQTPLTEWLAEDGAFHVDPKTVVRLGRPEGNGAGLLRRRAEVAGLEGRLEELERHREELVEEVAALAGEGDALRAGLADAEAESTRDALSLSQKDQELGHGEREADRLERVAENLRAAIAGLATERQTFAEQQDAQRRDAERWQAEKTALEERLRAADSRDAETAREAAELARKFMEKKVEHQKVASREEQFAARLVELETERLELDQKVAGSEQEMAAQHQAGKTIEERIEALTGSLEKRQKNHATARETLQEVARLYDERETGRRELSERVAGQRRLAEQGRSALHEVELQLAAERSRLAQWAESLAENAAQHPGQTPAPPSEEAEPMERETLEKELAAAQQKLGRMEGVNLGAAEEYDALTTRLEFLQRQKDDLEAAIADLQESIRRMNTESRRRFKETFDEVNEKFQKVFPLIFQGGAAR
ncbi:MAG: chromosome segregation protein SMC, partial [bacterium]